MGEVNEGILRRDSTVNVEGLKKFAKSDEEYPSVKGIESKEYEEVIPPIEKQKVRTAQEVKPETLFKKFIEEGMTPSEAGRKIEELQRTALRASRLVSRHLRAQKKKTESEVKADADVKKRIDHLPKEEQDKWVTIYVAAYNNYASDMGAEKAEEVAARTAWSKVPGKYKAKD